MCFKEISISHFVAFAVLQHVGKHDPIPQTTTQAPCHDHSHRSIHLEGVRHRLPPPLHRGDPPLPTLSQSGQMACGVSLRQEGVVPILEAPLAFPPIVGGGPTGIRHLPSPLQPLCVRLFNPRRRHDALRRRLHSAGICSHHCEGRDKCQPTVRYFGEVGRW